MRRSAIHARAVNPDLVYAMTGACGVTGGIATANRNVLLGLGRLCAERSRRLTVLSFLESEADRPPWLGRDAGFAAFEGSKPRFAAALLAAASRRPLVCFDHVQIALPVLPLTLAGWIRTVVFVHGSEAWWRLRRSNAWSFRAASRCLTNSTFTLGKLREHVNDVRARACPLGLSPELVLNEEVPGAPSQSVELEAADGKRRPIGDRMLLLVSRLDPTERQKGHRQLLRALPRLRAEFPQTQLVFAGPGRDREEIARSAREAGVAASVFLPGYVSTATLADLYARCYAYAMPSLQEGFGLVHLEAMNYAKPCLGCFDGAADVIVDGETGVLVRNPGDPAELAEALTALLRDPERARSLGRNGFRRLHESFTARCHQDRVAAEVGALLG